jgi:hypothetical protein
MSQPLLVFAGSFCLLACSAWVGTAIVRTRHASDEAWREDFGIVLAATLTLLGLIIGFTFSMAISRYDQRKSYEEGEANAIGTEYSRADLLPAADAATTRGLLKGYIEQRILFYVTRDEQQLRQIRVRTGQLQAELWTAIKLPAATQPNPVIALAVAGMNDVLNSQSYTQAAWWNRIPLAAWALMALIAVICNVMLGYGIRTFQSAKLLLLVLPLVLSVAFFLIADIDSPRGGIIHVIPQNLSSLSESMQ